MAVYETGLRKGREILNEVDPGVRWTDWMNNIGVCVDLDEDFNPTNTFSVTERLQGNTTHIWIKGVSFMVATELAERLIVGSTYMPPSRKNPVKTQTFDFEVGDLFPGDFHMHQANSMEMLRIFTYDDDSRMEISENIWFSLIDLIGNGPPMNKVGIVMSVEGNDSIPDRIMVAYSYDGRYFTAILRKKKEQCAGNFFSGVGIELT